MHQTNQTNQTNQMNQTNLINPVPLWYALRTRSRHEKRVRDQLEGRGFEQLLPTIVLLSQWKDRRKAIEVPLFSGYCFARFPWHTKLSVQMLAGVVEIVGGGHRPEPIPEAEIDSLRKLMASPLRCDPHPYLSSGMLVEVTRGPLQGVRGILLRKEKRHRLVLSVHLIQQAASVEIDAGDVAPV